ncbi:MAG: hypothetical protein HY791_32710 [Deltaproteobacteria bacterium]|nr:hypothetical protein [Deltaproteobacteria bacterium]
MLVALVALMLLTEPATHRVAAAPKQKEPSKAAPTKPTPRAAAEVAPEPAPTRTSTSATRVVVFPIEPGKGVASATAYQASRIMLGALGEIPTIGVDRALRLSKELGIDVRREARSCREELTCFVQLGRAIGADRLLIGSIKKQKGRDGLILRFSVIDTKAARYFDSIVWALPNDAEATRVAVRAAMRQLFTTPDARLVLKVQPEDARVFFYGELVGFPPYRDGREVPFWSGTYHGRVERPGFVAKEIRAVIPAGPTRIAVQLEPDPFWVEPPPERAIRPTEILSLVPEAEEEDLGPQSPFANPVGWIGIAAGVGVATLGGLVMSAAQADYNEVSGEIRYTRDRTRTAFEAIEIRSDANARRTIGVSVILSGVLVAGASFMWMALSSEEETREE